MSRWRACTSALEKLTTRRLAEENLVVGCRHLLLGPNGEAPCST